MIAERIRERYLRDSLPLRLGGLAADLGRVASCAADDRDRQALGSLLEEAKWFVEWAAPEAPGDIQAQLAELQITLALWHRRWLSGVTELVIREEAKAWSDRLLALSGLLS